MPQKRSNILIVDDNSEVLLAMEMYLKKHFTCVDVLKNPNLLLSRLNEKAYDAIILDMNFSAGVNTGNEGIYWMRKILEVDPEAIIILVTAYADIELAVRAVKEGAMDFIPKPWDNEKLLATIHSALKLRESKQKVHKLESKQKHLSKSINSSYQLIGGKSGKMQKALEMARKVANTDASVLILGENGTGKELLAREIHRNSGRSSDIFVGVDMASLTESLFESEMFGHVKGAFTDAKEGREGRFEVASGGTLFMDEIGNLSSAMQAKLLKAIEDGRIVKVGSNKAVEVDVRLISATNKPIYEMVEENTFREDLLYRINTIQIEIPPLRERGEDIPVLVDHFLEKFSQKYRKPKPSVTKPALEMLQKSPWYGNIRELRNTIEKTVILCDERTLRPQDFNLGKMKKAKTKPKSFDLGENEMHIIGEALKEYKGNYTEAAKALGITRATLYRKIEKYGI